MAGLSDTQEVNLLNYIFNGTPMPTAPAARWMSLHTADPGDTGASEHPLSNAYGRVNVTGAFPDASGTSGQLANDTAFSFPTATPSAWTTVTHWGLWSAETGGNFLCGGALSAAISIVAGGQASALVGDFVVTVS